MEIELEKISLLKLAELENLSVRAVNVCNNAELENLADILYYFLEHKTFKKIRNCGNNTDLELLEVCNKYIDGYVLPNIENDSVKIEPIKSEEEQLLLQLSGRKALVVNQYLRFLIAQLNVRPSNAIMSALGGDLTFKNYCDVFIISNFNFSNLRNIGKNSETELKIMHKRLLSFIREVIVLEDDNELEIQQTKLIIQSRFDIENEIIDNLFSEMAGVKIFKIVEYIIENELITQSHYSALIKEYFLYFQNKKKKTLDEVSKKIGVTRERARQLREKFIEDFYNIFSFLKGIPFNENNYYGFSFNDGIILIDNSVRDRINTNENTYFTSLFILKIFSVLFNQSHILIGDETKNLLQGIKKHSNNYLYLINKEIVDFFDFNLFLDNVNQRLQERIEETYSLNFKAYILEFLKIEDISQLDISQIDNISEICTEIIYQEFNILVLDDKLYFKRNTKKQVWEYGYEALKALGPKKEGHHIDVIYNWLLENYPDLEFVKSSLANSIGRIKSKFIYFGRTSTYGLKIWEEQYDNLKGGTIRELVIEYLEEKDEPAHISKITDYVMLYRDTNDKNVSANIKLDKSGIFIGFGKGFFGLSTKKYSEEYYEQLKKRTKITWEDNYERLVEFRKENPNSWPKSNGPSSEKNLYAFLARNKSKYNENKLSEDKIKKLQSIGYTFN